MMGKVICGKCNEKVIQKLKILGYEPVFLRYNLSVDQAIKNHADLSVIKIGENEFIIEKTQQELIKTLKSQGAIVHQTKSALEKPYPKDSILNFAIVGKYIIGNEKNADEILKQNAKEKGLTFINVNQGYANCSSLIINENAIITDDESIFKAANMHGIDALIIEKGDIDLDGYDYGFIGGASCNLNGNILFFGDIEQHKNFKQIETFLVKHNCQFDWISGLKLIDIGSMIIVN